MNDKTVVLIATGIVIGYLYALFRLRAAIRNDPDEFLSTVYKIAEADNQPRREQ